MLLLLSAQFIEMTLDDDDEEEEYEEPPKKRGRKPKNHASAPLPKLKKSKGISRSEERRQQEMHYMNLWREARAELKVMRQQLKVETIQESIDELNVDIAGLKRKKDEWAKLLGIQGAEV
jgi:FtsZ-interacting cell division protein YlmF